MDAKLRVIGGTHAGKEIRLATATFRIGRDPDCQLRAGSDLISRHHCEIHVEDARLMVRDLGSVNGTLVNGVKIEGATQLNPGDVLQIGSLQFEVMIEHRLGGAKRPAVKNLADAAARAAEAPPSKCAEDDISRWLGEPAPHMSGRWATRRPAAVDTQSVTDTQPIQAASGDTIKASIVSPDTIKGGLPPIVPPQSAKAAKKSGYGKLPKAQPPQAKDSCEAAAKVLKKLTKRH